MTAPRKTTAKSARRQPHKAVGKSSTPRKIQKQANVRVLRTKHIAPEQSPCPAPARQTKKAAVIALLVAAPIRPSKKAAIIGLLERPNGAAIGDLTAVTGWQVHSVRAALTGLRKDGRELIRAKGDAGVTRYRLTATG